jgi:hypothetical protein
MAGGAKKSIKSLRTKKSKSTSEPDDTMFVADIDERKHGDCLPDAIIATCCTLYWRYPDEFLPEWSFPHTVKEMHMWIVSVLRDRRLGMLAGRDPENIERIVQTNIAEDGYRA